MGDGRWKREGAGNFRFRISDFKRGEQGRKQKAGIGMRCVLATERVMKTPPPPPPPADLLVCLRDGLLRDAGFRWSFGPAAPSNDAPATVCQPAGLNAAIGRFEI